MKTEMLNLNEGYYMNFSIHAGKKDKPVGGKNTGSTKSNGGSGGDKKKK